MTSRFLYDMNQWLMLLLDCMQIKHKFILPGDKTVEQLHKLHIPAIFMPHGLGHFMGLDTHDVGGYPQGVERCPDPGICRLRAGRRLEAGETIL